MRIENINDNFLKTLDFNSLLKELLNKYFKINNGYKLTIKNDVLELNYRYDKNIIKEILFNKRNIDSTKRYILVEELIFKIQEDLIKNKVCKFYEYIKNENNCISKIYAIDFIKNNCEVNFKILGPIKLFVYIKAYLEFIEDKDKKLRFFHN